jgi:hypothetical protein
MLSEKQITELGKPFELKEHGFYLKSPYILKSAIRARLNRVVPGWILLPPELIAHDENVIIMRGGIQIGDVKRYAVGTGIVLRANSDGVAFDGAKLAGMISKAYKQATSDILPRAAVEFSMGEYLKNKPKNINEENFAGWLAKLTAAPVDPNAWIPENILAWGNKWKTKSLTDMQLLKALGIEGAWLNFKGTIAEADSAVEAFINLESFLPATPKAATAAALRPIDCPTSLLDKGDIILQSYKTSGNGPAETRYEVIENWGKVGNQYKLVLRDLKADKPETFHWSGGSQTLCDGPKVRAYANNPEVCLPAKSGGKPMWNGELAATG